VIQVAQFHQTPRSVVDTLLPYRKIDYLVTGHKRSGYDPITRARSEAVPLDACMAPPLHGHDLRKMGASAAAQGDSARLTPIMYVLRDLSL
jgi:hypothetical protein